jgi:hypothetical protein
MRIVSVTNKVMIEVMIEVTVAFTAGSKTKAATIKTTARVPSARWSSSAGSAEPPWSGAADRREIMTAVVAMLRTVMAPIAKRIARLPKGTHDQCGERRPGDPGDGNDGAGVDDVGRSGAGVSEVGVKH